MHHLFKIAVGLACLALHACSMAPPTEKARLHGEEDPRTLAIVLDGQMRKCWEREPSFSQDGIVIDSRVSIQDTVLISASRFASDIGLREPFLELEVLPMLEGGSEVVIREGDYACSLTGECFELKIAEDIERWMSGDSECGIER